MSPPSTPELDPARRLDVVRRLMAEEPLLHWLSEPEADHFTRYYGRTFEEGPISHALPVEVLESIRHRIEDHHLTLETGSGRSTVLLAALGRHHLCVSPDTQSVALIREYLDQVGLPRSQVTFIEESSDLALPELGLEERLDFVLIDGCHGYPYPALEWHYADLLLRPGGTICFDNTEFECVANHCDFMDRNPAYRFVEEVHSAALPPIYSARFYEKVSDAGFNDRLPRSRSDLEDPYADLLAKSD